MREPSIHTTESQLALVIDSIKYNYNIKKLSSEELAKLLLKGCAGQSSINRSVTISNDKLEKKITNILKSSKGDAMLLAGLIHKKRQQKRQRGVKLMTPQHRDWPQVKKLAECCVQFCNDFELKKKEGFSIYIDICLKKISSTSRILSKMLNMSEAVNNIYDAKLRILDDNHSGETKEAHDSYCNLITKNTGVGANYDDNPLVYQNFIEVVDECDRLNVPIDIYLQAQFHGLAWANSYPEPINLIGDKAVKRLNKYMFENKIKMADKNTKKSSSELSKALKNI